MNLPADVTRSAIAAASIAGRTLDSTPRGYWPTLRRLVVEMHASNDPVEQAAAVMLERLITERTPPIAERAIATPDPELIGPRET